MIPLLMMQNTEQMQRVGVFVLLSQNCLVERLCRRQPAGAVHFHGGGENFVRGGHKADEWSMRFIKENRAAILP